MSKIPDELVNKITEILKKFDKDNNLNSSEFIIEPICNNEMNDWGISIKYNSHKEYKNL